MSLALTSLGAQMFVDTDPLWHIAAGQWIRAHHSIPSTDPWSFTAGNYRWLNISWAWDCLFSAIVEHLGWHGAFAINALIITSVMLAIFANCARRSGDMLASLLTVIALMGLLVLNLRPLQITNLMTACWLLVLSCAIRGECSKRWLALLPLSMLIWVNCHGGFLVGPLLLAGFFLQALAQRHFAMARALLYTGIATLPAVLCNPYGLLIFEAAWRPLTTVANQFIAEWQPFIASPQHLLGKWYLILFLALTLNRPLPILAVERWMSYLWLALGLTSTRHLPLFAIISAPLVACSLHRLFDRYLPTLQHRVDALSIRINRRRPGLALLALCSLTALLLPSSFGSALYHHEQLAPDSLQPEVAFIQKNYPNMRFLTHFDLASILAYETRGAIPVFVDPRTETAFPPGVLADYLHIDRADPGWEAIMARYHIDGVILPNATDNPMLDRFRQRRGWAEAFKGPRATIFIRE